MPKMEKMRSGRQELPQKAVLRSGDDLVMSSKLDESSSKYLEDIDTSMPEKLKAKKADLSQMRTVKSTQEDRHVKAVGDITLDTGDVEIGYDSKKQDSVLGFVHRTSTETARQVNQEGATTKQMKDDVKLNSNDRYFYGGAVAMHTQASNTSKKISRQLGDVSKMDGGKSTIDEVVPFMNDNLERERLKSLRELSHSSKDERSNIGAAVTGLGRLISVKQQRKMQFIQKLNVAVNNVKEVQRTDDSYLLLKKKRLAVLKELAEDANFAPTYILDEEFKQ